jgi:hypothetical protein
MMVFDNISCLRDGKRPYSVILDPLSPVLTLENNVRALFFVGVNAVTHEPTCEITRE